MYYQKALCSTFFESFSISGILLVNFLINLEYTGSLYAICLQKYSARPDLKFFNSKTIIPGETCITQPTNLPLPLPIREPSVFLVNGTWGNIWNQTYREVFSDLRVAFFKNNLILKNLCAVIRSACNTTNPYWP